MVSRLIKNQDIRLAQQARCQGHTLLLASRQLQMKSKTIWMKPKSHTVIVQTSKQDERVLTSSRGSKFQPVEPVVGIVERQSLHSPGQQQEPTDTKLPYRFKNIGMQQNHTMAAFSWFQCKNGQTNDIRIQLGQWHAWKNKAKTKIWSVTL